METLKEIMGILILDEILKATGGRILCGKEREFSGLSTDSRTIKNGELFIALKGDNFDGHNFIHDALKKGAGAVVHFPPVEPVKGKTIIHVKNTLSALHDIARYLRLKVNIPVIGVTGTNGKTTTKELISSIFGKKHKVLKTYGNLNNHIGLPSCLANMEGDENIMVLEMGSNARGDIKLLCDIAHPDYAVVTNVGHAHLKGFGSLEMVRKTDLEILEYVKAASVNADDLFLLEGLKEFKGKIITYGIDNASDVCAKNIALGERGSNFRLCFSDGRDIDVNLSIAGKFNIYNALAAASIADEFDISPEDIKRGLEGFTGVPMRLSIKDLSGALIISDVYNANPSSMEEALKELSRLKRLRTIAVLGDMLELGSYAEEAHKNLVRSLSELNVDIFIAVGAEMIRASSEFSGTCYRADDAVAAKAILLSICGEGDTILVKGSRGMRMERVLSEAIAPPAEEGGHAL